MLAQHWDRLGETIVATLRSFQCSRAPTNSVRTVPRLRRMAAPLLPEAIWRARLEALLAHGTLLA
ncbi:MAG: hypothetical protein WDN04_05235 [Rhodospirillales bacterium]